MLRDYRAFMSPEPCSKVSSRAGKPRHIPLRQSRHYKPRACFLFHRSLRFDPFLRWPALKCFRSTHRYQLEKKWSQAIYCINYEIKYYIPPTHTDALFIYSLGHPFARDLRQRKTVFDAIVVGRWPVSIFYVCLNHSLSGNVIDVS